MPKKRKNRGRSKGNKGKVSRIPCSACGALVPRDKIKKVTIWHTPLDPQLEKELQSAGAFLSKVRVIRYYCVSCAMFRGIISARAREERKIKKPLVAA